MRRLLAVLLVLCALFSCGGGYKPVSQQLAYDIYKAKAKPERVEVSGQMLNPNSGYLELNDAFGIETDLAVNKKKAEKLMDVLEKLGNPGRLEFRVKGDFRSIGQTENMLYVNQVIILESGRTRANVGF
jgi:hypothetical protein